MKAFIKAISFYLPTKVVTNDDLTNEFPEWNAEKVAQKIGIKERHVCKENESAVTLAINAAERVFKEYNIEKNSIDFILFCTQSPLYILPTSACILQKELKLPNNIGALDFNLGCSGYIYGLSLAKGLIFSGTAKNILFITAETYNKYISKEDKGNRSLFGDGASATIISTDGFAEIGNFSLGTDGEGAENLIVKNHSDNLYMNGPEIFTFTLKVVPQLVENTLKKNNLSTKDINLFLFHQANKFMLETIRKVCKIKEELFYINMEKSGNTVSSTIPIALKKIIDERKIKEKENILITGFGVGYSWGGTVLTINHNINNI